MGEGRDTKLRKRLARADPSALVSGSRTFPHKSRAEHESFGFEDAKFNELFQPFGEIVMGVFGPPFIRIDGYQFAGADFIQCLRKDDR